jgi:ATP/maltotriose-dependent transcriptional regulator MalT
VKETFVIAVEASFALGDLDRVERLLAELAAMTPGETPPSLRAHTARFEARLAARRGEHERVEASFTAAADAFRELGFPFHTAVAELEHGEWLLETGRAEEAAPLLAEARAAFEMLKARPWVDRVDRLELPQIAVPARS